MNKLKLVLNKIPSGVKVCVVTKKRSWEDIKSVIENGATIVGENKIQEAKDKFDSYIEEKSDSGDNLIKGVEKHFIGHLQTNKAKEAIRLFEVIQSVDSFKLLDKINKEADKLGKVVRCFLQVNIAKDQNKFGFEEHSLWEGLKSRDFLRYKGVLIEGLMMIGRLTENKEATRNDFKKMKQLFEKIRSENILGIKMNYLSMGMSNDYKIAIEEGANMVRLGRAVF